MDSEKRNNRIQIWCKMTISRSNPIKRTQIRPKKFGYGFFLSFVFFVFNSILKNVYLLHSFILYQFPGKWIWLIAWLKHYNNFGQCILKKKIDSRSKLFTSADLFPQKTEQKCFRITIMKPELESLNCRLRGRKCGKVLEREIERERETCTAKERWYKSKNTEHKRRVNEDEIDGEKDFFKLTLESDPWFFLNPSTFPVTMTWIVLNRKGRQIRVAHIEGLYAQDRREESSPIPHQVDWLIGGSHCSNYLQRTTSG